MKADLRDAVFTLLPSRILLCTFLELRWNAFCVCRKGRRKTEKDAPSPSPEQQREYLEEEYVRDKISDCDLNQLVTLPAGLDYNEWLATHSEYSVSDVGLSAG